MKNLLQKSLTQLSIYAFLIFALSIPSYFLLVDWIWLKELDENNHLISQRIQHEFNDQNIDQLQLEQNIQFWNEIQPVSKILPSKSETFRDSVYSILRQNPYSDTESIDRFRGLKTLKTIHGKPYILIVETNVEETEETVAYIAGVTLLFFLLLVIGFWIINKRLSSKLWKPFQDTLSKLKTFNLSEQKPIQYQDTNIIEFAELNQTLDKLIQHNIAVFKNQKSFAENASHELQTPLAVLKNKLDILMQTEGLTEKQYNLAEDMNKALVRSSRIYKNLLLLSKIENYQFSNSEQVQLDDILLQCLENLQEYATEKNIQIIRVTNQVVVVSGNSVLVEILFNNLLLNAIRYTAVNGTIHIKLNNKSFQICNSGDHELPKDRLFERFSRFNLENTGSGLGLSIVYEIAKFLNWKADYKFYEQHCFSIQFNEE